MEATSAKSKRADIQGLRAIAVLLVLGYHYFPANVWGGFVGVDVFFVISGFLITLKLIREIAAGGRISIRGFYAGRIRRLMPAALVVTVVTVLAAAVLLGPLRLMTVFQDAAWATVYLANVHLAQQPTGYFATTDPSLFTHFWSLAVEEQYYLVWPLLLTVVVLVTGPRWFRFARVVLGVVFAGSLAASIVLTSAGSNNAYYSLGTRAWEFAIGGAVAFLVFAGRFAPRPWVAQVVSSLGAVAILSAAFVYTQGTQFPSWTAGVPTVGAALIIWAGSYHRTVVGRALTVRPAQFVGNISYSLYLWHWPLLILSAPFVGAGHVARFLLMVVAGLLATATYYLIEQKRALPRAAPTRVLAAGIAVVVAVAGTLTLAVATVPSSGGPSIASVPLPAERARLVGSTVTMYPAFRSVSPGFVPSNVTPTLANLPADLADIFTNGCVNTVKVHVCQGGDPKGTIKIVLAGDSQAAQWWPALNRAGVDNGWKIYLAAKSGCPLAAVTITNIQPESDSPGCSSWQRKMVPAVVALHADLVVYANHTYGYRGGSDISAADAGIWRAGVTSVLNRITAVSPVLYFGQFPTLKSDVGACLLQNLRAVTKCETPRKVAVTLGTEALGRSLAASSHATYFDPATLLCDAECSPVYGNHILYRDHEHLTSSAALRLAPAIGRVVSAALG